MSWLDKIKIGRDLIICPDCDREYEVIDEFEARGHKEHTIGDDWLDEMFSDEYYVALRCPQCLETRHLRLKSLMKNQYYNAKKAQEGESE